MKRRLLVAVVLLFGASVVFANLPGWWKNAGTTIIDEQSQENNYAPANLGQLKYVAKQAKTYFDATLPGGAGTEITSLVNSFEPRNGQGYTQQQIDAFIEDNYSPVNVGQLKAVAKPFYDRLLSIGYDTKANLISRGYPNNWAHNYPWDSQTPVSENYSPANLGQLKLVFSFDLSDDRDIVPNGLPDWWEQHYFQEGGIDPDALAPRGGGLTNLEAFQQGLNPIDFFNGKQPSINIISGNNQEGHVGTFLADPLVVEISGQNGVIPYAPVRFILESGPGGIADSPSSAAVSEVNVSADAEGYARVYFKLPASTGTSIAHAFPGTGDYENYSSFTVKAAEYPAVNLSVSGTSVMEGATTPLVFTFTRDGATDDSLVVNFGVGGSATEGADYQLLNHSVTILAGQNSASVNVAPVIDGLYDPNEIITLFIIAEPGARYVLGTSSTQVATILDAIPVSGGLRLRLQADKGVLTTGSLNEVSAWQDQSGLNKHASQATSGRQPILVDSGANGLPAIQFDGSNDYFNLVSDLFGASAQAEVFVVLKVDSVTPSSSKGLWNLGAGNTNYRTLYPATDGAIWDAFHRYDSVNLGKPSQSLDQLHIYNVTSKANEWMSRINGQVLYRTTSSSVYAANSSLTLGSSKANGNYFAGVISEIIVYNRIISSQEREAMERYLNSHYSIVSAPPSEPTGLSVARIAQTQASIKWDAPATSSNFKYILERSKNGGSYQIIVVVENGGSYLDSNLEEGATYTYRLKANNLSGDSDYADEVALSGTQVGQTSMPIDNIRLWLKADSGISTGGGIVRWEDQSGNNRDATQITPANSPALVGSVLNSKPVVRFNGVNQFFNLPTDVLSGASQGDVFVVLKAQNSQPSVSKGLWNFGGNNSNYETLYPASDGSIRDAFLRIDLVNCGKPSQPLDQFHIYNVSSKSGEWQSRINGNIIYMTSTSFPYTNTGITLGKSKSASYFAGDIAEIIIYGRVLGQNERDAVGAYLNSRYSLVQNPPEAPDGASAKRLSSAQALIVWSVSPSALVVEYQIERRTGSNGTFEVVGTVRNGGSYIDSNLIAGNDYFYRIRAINYAGFSPYSEQIYISNKSPNNGVVPLANLRLWLRADVGVPSGDTGVRFWMDMSGKSQTAVQTDISKQPVWVPDAIDGRPVVRFNGSSFLNVGASSNFLQNATEAEAFVMLRVANRYPLQSRSLWNFGANNYQYDVFYPKNDGTLSDTFGRMTVMGLGSPNKDLEEFHVYNVVSKAGSWEARVDGLIINSQFSNTFYHSIPATLGRSVSGNYYFDGDIAEIMIFDRVLTVDERRGIAAYMKEKFPVLKTGTGQETLIGEDWEEPSLPGWEMPSPDPEDETVPEIILHYPNDAIPLN